MKRMRSRLVSILLIIAMLTTMLPVQVFATELEVEAPADIVTASEPIEVFSTATQSNIAPQSDFSFTTISGKVTDASGNGVAGVSVMLYNYDENVALTLCSTSTSGAWQSVEYEAITGYTYTIRFYKAGYTFSENDIQIVALSGSTTIDTVIATAVEVNDLECNPADYSY